MNRKDYNNFRNWDLPADENGDDPGYLVEYTDGGKPNVEGFAGYVSWSPAEQFENAYRPIEVTNLLPHQVRVVIEHDELAGRLVALQAFLNTDLFKSLDKLEQNRMEKQAQLMYELRVVLADRIAAFNK